MSHEKGHYDRLLTSPHIEDPFGLPGDFCCGCEPGQSRCCRKNLGGEICCMRIGQKGTYTRNEISFTQNVCCTNLLFCGPPDHVQVEPGCFDVICHGNQTSWEMTVVYCGSIGNPNDGFIGTILVPTGGANPECGYPLGVFGGQYQNLSFVCGWCLPCGPPSVCVRECESDCYCVIPQPQGCCPGLNTGPGSSEHHCANCGSKKPDGCVESQHHCTPNGFELQCYDNLMDCEKGGKGEGPCVGDCTVHVLLTTAKLEMEYPGCRFCFENTDGLSGCMDDDDYADFCED